MTKPTVDGRITLGNIVSWTLIAISLVVGYTKLQDASAQNSKDTGEAKAMAANVRDSMSISDSRRERELSEVKMDIAVIKANVFNMDGKLDDIIANQHK